MDTALWQGDFFVESGGLPILLTGEKERLQQARIRLLVKKGSFAYDPSLGSRLYTLEKDDPAVEKKALQWMQEALQACPQVQLKQVEVTEMVVLVQLSAGSIDETVEIPLRQEGGISIGRTDL